jgi:stage V sporulation protein G
MEITEVRVRKVNSGNRVKAIAQITFDNEFVVHEIKVMEKPEGLFIAMPRRKKGERYYDIAHPINQEVRDKLTKAVLEKYEEAEDPEPVNKTEAESEDAE